MQKSVADACFVYVARFRVVYFEVLVSSVMIRTRNEISMERNDIIHQISSECLYILTLTFSLYEFFPRGKQIFKRDDILICNTP